MTYLLLILISNIYKYIKYKINTLKEVLAKTSPKQDLGNPARKEVFAKTSPKANR